MATQTYRGYIIEYRGYVNNHSSITHYYSYLFINLPVRLLQKVQTMNRATKPYQRRHLLWTRYRLRKFEQSVNGIDPDIVDNDCIMDLKDCIMRITGIIERERDRLIGA